MSSVPMTLRLATAIAWSGATSEAAIWSRLPRAASAWATRSIWPSPIEFSHSCHGAEDRRQVRLDVRDRVGELADRGGQRAGRDDHDDEDQARHAP